MFRNLILCGVVALSTMGVANAAEVIWNYNNQAVAAGTGCNSRVGDTFFVASGNQISVVMSDLGVDIASLGAPISARKNCRVRIPTRLSRGIYVGRLTQTMGYGVAKTAQATADITSSAFWNIPDASGYITRVNANPMRAYFGRGTAVTNSALSASTYNDYSVFKPSWCARSAGFDTMFSMDMAVAATAGFSDGMGMNYDGTVTTQIDGADLRWDAVAGVYFCNQ